MRSVSDAPPSGTPGPAWSPTDVPAALQSPRAATSSRSDWLLLAANRRFLYRWLAVAYFLLACLAMVARTHKSGVQFNFAVGDGEGYFVYLPSLVVDGDLDFRNQVRLSPEEARHVENFDVMSSRGYLLDKYPIGVALSVSPAYLVADGIERAVIAIAPHRFLPRDGFNLAYQLACLVAVLMYGCAGMMILDAMLVRRFAYDGRAIAAAIVSFWVGTCYAYYYFRHPFMAHVVSAFWIILIVHFWDRLIAHLRSGDGKPRPGLWFGLIFAVSMAFDCRNTDLFIFPFLIHLAWAVLKTRAVRATLRAMPIALLGLAPFILQAAIWKRMTGNWLQYSYGDERFLWTSPALLQTLFSTRHGLFTWSPLLLLSAVGICVFFIRRRHLRFDEAASKRVPDFQSQIANHKSQARVQSGDWQSAMVVCLLLLSAIPLWYVNSAWHTWWFGHAFGARAFIELAPLFVIGLAELFDASRRRGASATRLVGAAVLLAVVFNYGLMALYETKRINRDGYPLERENASIAALDRD